MKKRISTRVICLLVALTLLTGALMVSAINGSPYEALKNAALDALFFDNVTIEMEATLRIDGEVYESASVFTALGEARSLTVENDGYYSVRDHGRHVSYTTPYFRLNTTVVTDCGTQWYAVRRQNNVSWRNSIGYEMFGAGGRQSNHLRLVEVMIDLFVGDLKNNFVISSYGSDMRRVTGAVTESQLPEFIRVIIDLAVEESSRWRDTDNMTRDDFRSVLDIPVTGVSINRIAITADIDNSGSLRVANLTGQVTIQNIFGDTHVLDMELDVTFSDIGTTVPLSPFAGVNELFTPDFFASVIGGSGLNRTLYFALDEDGNIDIDSITATWPQPRYDVICRLREALALDVEEYEDAVAEEYALEVEEETDEESEETVAS